MSDPYVLIEGEAFVVWSAPQLPTPTVSKQNAVGLTFTTG